MKFITISLIVRAPHPTTGHSRASVSHEALRRAHLQLISAPEGT